MTDEAKTTGIKNPLCVELGIPLMTPSGKVETVTLRRGKAKDMLNAQRIEPDEARRELTLISILSEEKLTVEDLEELDLADMSAVQEAFRLVFVCPPKNG